MYQYFMIVEFIGAEVRPLPPVRPDPNGEINIETFRLSCSAAAAPLRSSVISGGDVCALLTCKM